MRAIHFYIILFLVGIGFSCKKKTYPNDTFDNDVVYYLKATINNEPVSFEAGKDDYYMFSSVQQDASGVYNFSANLKKSGCANCNTNNSLEIEISDFKISAPGAPAMIDSALQVRTYALLTSTTTAYLVKFKSSYTINKTAQSYSWDFGDGSPKSIEIDPPHVYKKPGIYNVCLSVTSTDGCVSNICNLQKIGLDADLCKASISATATSGTDVNFTAVTTGNKPMTYVWDFGDGERSTAESPGTHTYNTAGGRTVRLTVTDNNNNVATANYNVVTQGDPSSCAANYEVESITTGSNEPGNYIFSKVIINWTDAHGRFHTSRNLLQPADSYFKILSVEDYEANENGQKTKKLHVQFRCTVFNGTDYMLIDNADAVISVAYN